MRDLHLKSDRSLFSAGEFIQLQRRNQRLPTVSEILPSKQIETEDMGLKETSGPETY
jgi:hypothetical protein